MEEGVSEEETEDRFEQSQDVEEDSGKAIDSDHDECYLCGQICPLKTLKAHIQAHIENTVYQCNECGRVLKSKKTYKRHKKIHRTHWMCPYCYKKLATEEELLQHVCYASSRSKPCETCGKEFSTMYDLKRHVRSHTNEKPYLCDICNKSFTQKGNRNLHARIHLKDKSVPPPPREKKYVCEICFQAFGYKQHLNRHVIIHTGEKPHVCPVCEKGFNQSNHLKNHILTHSEEKPYVCKECEKCFKCKTNLIEHEKRHGKPQYFCSVCNKGFYTSVTCDQHYKTHSKLRPYTCDICHKNFSVASSLEGHYLKHAKKNLKSHEIAEEVAQTE